MPGLDPQMLDLIAADWDPTPFNAALEQATAQMSPGMDPALAGGGEVGSGYPASAPDLGSVLGGPAAKKPPMSPIPMPNMAAPPPQQMAPSGGLARNPAMGTGTPGYPGMPKPGKVPTLAEILGG